MIEEKLTKAVDNAMSGLPVSIFVEEEDDGVAFWNQTEK